MASRYLSGGKPAKLVPLRPAPISVPRGPGIRVRFSRIDGETDEGCLKQPLYLPVILGDLAEHEDFAHVDYSTTDAGEFSLPEAESKSARPLRTSDLETLTLDWHRAARFLSNPGLTPEDCRKQLYALGRSKTGFQLLATLSLKEGSSSEIRWKATLRSIDRVLRPGEADTRYMTLSLKEWRDNSTSVRGKGKAKAKGGGKLPTTKKITANTTIASAAKEFYGGDVSLSEGGGLIARANKLARWGSKMPIHEAKGWKVGDTLKIPKPSARDVFVGGKTVVGSGLR